MSWRDIVPKEYHTTMTVKVFGELKTVPCVISLVAFEAKYQGLEDLTPSEEALIEKFVAYINQHSMELINSINNHITNSIPFIEALLVGQIRRDFDPLPKHYELKENALVKTETVVNATQPIEDILQNELYGENSLTYGDKYSILTQKIAKLLMKDGIKLYLEQVFNMDISYRYSNAVYEKIHDIICDKCILSSPCLWKDVLDITTLCGAELSLILCSSGSWRYKKCKTS